MEKLIGILEEESEYPRRLARYINDRKDIGCMAVAFQSPAEVLHFEEKTPLSALLVGNGTYTQEEWESFSKSLPGDGQLWKLSEEPVAVGELLSSGIRQVFRYQRAGELIKQILKEEGGQGSVFGGLYTVYSPAGSISSERFAWQLAKHLSLYGSTLFLSWEPFRGFGRDRTDAGNMTDDLSALLYLLRLEHFSKKERLLSLPVLEGVKYIPGAAYCTDLWQYSAEELLRFLALCSQCGYQNIVFLAGFFSEAVEALMEQSTAVCLVTGETPEEDKRCKEFFRQMKYAGKQTLLSRVREVREAESEEFFHTIKKEGGA